MIKDIHASKKEISEYLNTFFEKNKRELFEVNEWVENVFNKFQEITLQGKMIRGGLITNTAKYLNSTTPIEEIIKISAAIEIIHTSLLVHDDIMDQDDLRRGKKTIHKQYEQTPDINQNKRFGESMSTCFGDIGFFLAFKIISQTKIPQNTKNELQKLITNELTKVCLAQMQDVHYSHYKLNPTQENVINLYKHKTARYTFSLPLMIGAILSNSQKQELEQLSKIGEGMGIIFQIKDDELGIFGTQKKIGKPIGSDIKEGKKTIHYLLLLEELNEKEKKEILKIYGNKNITKKQIQKIRELIIEKKILQKTQKLIEKKQEETMKIIKELNSQELKKNLIILLEYNLKREK